MATITAMSSRGQIVLPISIRRKLGLGEGSQFLVVTIPRTGTEQECHNNFVYL